MAREFDLLGHPIPDNHGKVGANGHTPSAETINKVRGLLVSGIDKKDIAAELGITMPTLTKHYFQSGKINVRLARAKARSEQRAKLMLKLDEAIDGGNVSAMRTMKQILDEEDLAERAREASGDPAKQSAKEKPLPKGKKDQMNATAETLWANDPLLSQKAH